MKSFLSLLGTSLAVLLLFTVITGLVYPVVVTAIAGAVMPRQAGGSVIMDGDRAVGSALIGQPFDGPEWFWGRPSATAPHAYNAAASTGSNLGPTNPALKDAVAGRVAALRQADPGNEAPVPVDLGTASGSGLDPEVSPAAALYQVRRVARARGLDEAQVRGLVDRSVQARSFGVLGEPRVNVLALNLALARLPSAGDERGQQR